MMPRTQSVISRFLTAVALNGLLSVASAQDCPKIMTTTPIKDIPTTTPSKGIPTTTPTNNIMNPAVSLAAKDWKALRMWFHQPQFNISDGLDTYASDYR